MLSGNGDGSSRSPGLSQSVAGVGVTRYSLLSSSGPACFLPVATLRQRRTTKKKKKPISSEGRGGTRGMHSSPTTPARRAPWRDAVAQPSVGEERKGGRREITITPSAPKPKNGLFE